MDQEPAQYLNGLFNLGLVAVDVGSAFHSSPQVDGATAHLHRRRGPGAGTLALRDKHIHLYPRPLKHNH